MPIGADLAGEGQLVGFEEDGSLARDRHSG
jgi:hypothetical protein